MKVSPILRDAPYSAALPRELGWCHVLTALEADLAKRDIALSEADCTLYLSQS